MDLARYFTYASWDLRVALDVSIFTLKYPVGHPKNRRDAGGVYANGLNNETLVKKWNQEHPKVEPPKLTVLAAQGKEQLNSSYNC
jgi:hypothetical protein